MVQLGVTGLVGLLAATKSANAAPQRQVGSSDPATCVADNYLYRSGLVYNMNGGNYMVHCAKDSSGDTTSSEHIDFGGFAACSASCELKSGCDGFTYVGGFFSGTCYYKLDVGSHSNAGDDMVTCKNQHGGPPGSEPEPVSSSSSPPSSLWASTSSSTSASVASSSSHVSTSSSSSTAAAYSTSTIANPSSSGPGSSSSPASGASSPSFSSSTGSSTSVASPTSSAVGQCQQAVKTYGNPYRDSSGSSYQLECGTDHYGGDLTNTGSDTYLGCTAICDANPDCIGYAYVPRICYLKSSLTTASANSGVDFAVNLNRNSSRGASSSGTGFTNSNTASGASNTMSGTSNTVSVPSGITSAPSSTSTTSMPSAQPGSCGYIAANGTNAYMDANNVRYTIECNTDHNGGDLSAASANTFVECMGICDKTDKCIAFSWAGANDGNGPGNCYLKNEVTGEGPDPGVDYAYKKAATNLSPSSSFPSASSSSTSTSKVATSSSMASSGTQLSTSTSTSASASTSNRITTTTETSYTSSAWSSTTRPTGGPPPDPKPSGPGPGGISTTPTMSTSSVKTSVSQPEQPKESALEGDAKWCHDWVRKEKWMVLRVQVLEGAGKWRDWPPMWMADPPRDQKTSRAVLTDKHDNATLFFVHPVTKTLVSWHDDDDCALREARMTLPRKEVIWVKGTGTPGFVHDRQLFKFGRGDFGGWMMCDFYEGEKQVMWWDKREEYEKMADRYSCAIVYFRFQAWKLGGCDLTKPGC